MTSGIDTIEERLRACLSTVVGEQGRSIARDLSLRESLTSFDSLAAAEYISHVEGEFDVEIDFVIHDVRFRMSTIERGAEFVRELIEDGEALLS